MSGIVFFRRALLGAFLVLLVVGVAFQGNSQRVKNAQVAAPECPGGNTMQSIRLSGDNVNVCTICAGLGAVCIEDCRKKCADAAGNVPFDETQACNLKCADPVQMDNVAPPVQGAPDDPFKGVIAGGGAPPPANGVGYNQLGGLPPVKPECKHPGPMGSCYSDAEWEYLGHTAGGGGGSNSGGGGGGGASGGGGGGTSGGGGGSEIMTKDPCDQYNRGISLITKGGNPCDTAVSSGGGGGGGGATSSSVANGQSSSALLCPQLSPEERTQEFWELRCLNEWTVGVNKCIEGYSIGCGLGLSPSDDACVEPHDDHLFFCIQERYQCIADGRDQLVYYPISSEHPNGMDFHPCITAYYSCLESFSCGESSHSSSDGETSGTTSGGGRGGGSNSGGGGGGQGSSNASTMSSVMSSSGNGTSGTTGGGISTSSSSSSSFSNLSSSRSSSVISSSTSSAGFNSSESSESSVQASSSSSSEDGICSEVQCLFASCPTGTICQTISTPGVGVCDIECIPLDTTFTSSSSSTTTFSYSSANYTLSSSSRRPSVTTGTSSFPSGSTNSFAQDPVIPNFPSSQSPFNESGFTSSRSASKSSSAITAVPKGQRVAADGYCGDGTVQQHLLETCDRGNLNGAMGSPCSRSCQAQSSNFCGNGFVDAGEQCDLGLQNSDTQPDACRTTCSSYRCGDSVVDSGEQCDDGNVKNGDSCSSTCVVEYLSAPTNPVEVITLSLKSPLPSTVGTTVNADITTIATSHAPAGQAGPGAIAAIAAGAASGFAWVKRRRVKM